MKDHTNLNTNMLNTCLKLQSDSLIRYFLKGKIYVSMDSEDTPAVLTTSFGIT